MAEQILEANIPCVVRFRKIVQFARELDVKCDANFISPTTAFAKLSAVAGLADDTTVDDLIAEELASASSVNYLVDGIQSITAGQEGVAYTWSWPAIGEGLPGRTSTALVGSLPGGLTYDPGTETISGTPSASTAGGYLVEFAVAYADDFEYVQRYLMAIYPAA